VRAGEEISAELRKKIVYMYLTVFIIREPEFERFRQFFPLLLYFRKFLRVLRHRDRDRGARKRIIGFFPPISKQELTGVRVCLFV
jgi:hypothetical protein